MSGEAGVLEVGAAIDAAALSALRGDFRGDLIRPGDGRYEDARRVWNAMVDRRPALIARCAGPADVVAAVAFARERGLVLSVRGGAHNVPGNAVCDAGVVVDMSAMKSARVDPHGRTVRAEAGLKWGELDAETQAFGLATTGGTFSDTGIAGLTLGGGMGWLGGQYGLACDNLVSVDLVTADGRLLTASADEHPDLFWAVRGGGGNFGVVTSFEYHLHEVGTVLGGLLIHPFARARELLRLYRDFLRSAPDELTTLAVCLTHPEAGAVIAIVVCWSGPLTQGERVLAPLRSFGPPIIDEVAPMSYCAMQMSADRLAPAGRHWYAKGPFVREISDGLIDAFVDGFESVSSPHTLMLLQQKGGAMARGRPDQTAFAHRDASHVCVVFASWTDPAGADRHIDWARATTEAIWPHTVGAEYVNDLGIEADVGTDRIRASYAGNYDRLAAIKAAYDPANLFRHNQNIKPASGEPRLSNL